MAANHQSMSFQNIYLQVKQGLPLPILIQLRSLENLSKGSILGQAALLHIEDYGLQQSLCS